MWAAIILAASSELFGAGHTGSWLQQFVTWISGSPLSDTTAEVANFVLRKLGHLTAYGLFGALMFRAIRGGRAGWAAGWAVGAVVAAAILASIDEFHQTFVPGRTGVFADVVIDTCGATIAQILARLR